MRLITSLLVLILSTDLSAQNQLKDLLGSSTNDGVPVQIEVIGAGPTQFELYKQAVQKLKDTDQFSDSAGVELLKGLTLVKRYEGKEGIEMPQRLSEVTPKGEGIQSFEGTQIPECGQASILKRVPEKYDSKNTEVLRDVLYVYSDMIPQGKEPSELYGADVSVRRIDRNASVRDFQIFRVDGASCLPYRYRLIGEIQYRIFGLAAFKKY